MNLFDKLVNQALENEPSLSQLRVVVEKELLHHDILRILSEFNLLKDLTFIGGTCLRACYGAVRLSEDLDFTGGKEFDRKTLSEMAAILVNNLQEKYGLKVVVSEPIKDKQNVDTWKIKIETRPGKSHLPAQRINIDICAVNSYEVKPMLLLNPYGVDMGTSGLIIQAQSREEIYTDKLLAFAFRPNRIKYRDLWDILWLHEQGLKPRLELIPKKLANRDRSFDSFVNAFSERLDFLDNPDVFLEFKMEMSRFLPQSKIKAILENADLWIFLKYLLANLKDQILQIKH